MKKRHHFIPQFYLKRFASLEPDEEIWTYDIEDGVTRESTVDNTAFEKYLYSLTLEDGKRLDDLENLISAIEGKAAPVLAKLITGEDVSDQERLDFSSFIAIMYVRTDAFRHQFAQTMAAGLQIINYATAIHDDAFKSSMEKYQREEGNLSPEEIEGLREAMLNPQKFTISVDKEWTLKALSFHDKLAPIFFKMHWSILIAKAPRYFITSDNPVVFEVPSQHRHPFYGGGLLHKKVELTLPLSSETCLLATWDKDLPTRAKIDSEAIKTLNRHRAIYARRYLFGPRRDSGIERLGTKYKDVRPEMKMSGFGPEEYSRVELHRRGCRS